MQPGKPQGFGIIGPDEHPDLHPARQPGQLATSPSSCSCGRCIRRMLGGRARSRRPIVRGHVHAALTRRRRASGSSPARWFDVERRRRTSRSRVGGAPARTWWATWPHANALIVVPERRDRGAAGGERSTSWCSERRQHVTVPAAHPRRRARRRAHGRRVRQGRHVRTATRHRAGPGLCRRWSAAARRRCAQGRRARGRPDRRHPGRQADAGPGAAVPPDRAARRRRSTSRSPTTPSTITRHRADRRPHRRRDGGADRVAVAGAHRRRHGQGGRPGGASSPTCGSRRRPAASGERRLATRRRRRS